MYEWSSDGRLTEFSDTDYTADTLALLTCAAIVLILVYLPTAPPPLVCNWAAAGLTLHITSGGAAVESALFSAAAAYAGVRALGHNKAGLRLVLAAAIPRHVPPHALGVRSAQYARFFLCSAILGECHADACGLAVAGGLVLVGLVPLMHPVDAWILGASLYVGGHFTRGRARRNGKPLV